MYKAYGHLSLNKPRITKLPLDKAKKLEQDYAINSTDDVKAVITSGEYLTLYGLDMETLAKTFTKWNRHGL